MSSTIKVEALMMEPDLYSHPRTTIGYDRSRHWTHIPTTGFVSPQKLCKKSSSAACSCRWCSHIASVEDDRHEPVCSPPVAVATQIIVTKHFDKSWLPVPILTSWRTHMLLDGFCSTADVFSGLCPYRRWTIFIHNCRWCFTFWLTETLLQRSKHVDGSMKSTR
jgi:hypothetical protein